MKVLLDTCVWDGVVQELRAAGHDVVWGGLIDARKIDLTPNSVRMRHPQVFPRLNNT